MDNYAIYLRKSRSDDPNTSIHETLSRHEKILLDTAKKMNLSVVKIYREVVSGETIADRPQMQSLLNDINEGLYAGVLVVEIERLARGNSIDQGIIAQSFQLSDTKVITPYKVIDPNNEFDAESLEFSLFMSRREYKTINRRLQRGRIASVKEGKYVGNKPPYGYNRIPLDKDKGFTLELHPEQAPVVKMIFDLYVHGDNGKRIGTSLIARKLNNMNIPAQYGMWTSSTIQTMLRNPVYAGKIRWNSRPAIKKIIDGIIKKERPRIRREDWILSDGIHPAIIDIETFNLANQYISTNRPNPNPSQSAIKNPLSGLIECGLCGRKMVRRPYNNRTQPDTLMCPFPQCKNISSLLNIVEEAILKLLSDWSKEYQLTFHQTSSNNVSLELLEKSISDIDKEIELTQKQTSKAYDLLEQGIYSTDIFLDRTKALSEKTKSLIVQKEYLQNEIKQLKENEAARQNIIPKIDNIIRTYRDIEDPYEKNILLKQILEKVTYLKSTKSTKTNISNDLVLTLFPRIY